ncbi:hypothetical protein ABID22_001573 [Pontibacter aydingkolensis]
MYYITVQKVISLHFMYSHVVHTLFMAIYCNLIKNIASKTKAMEQETSYLVKPVFRLAE